MTAPPPAVIIRVEPLVGTCCDDGDEDGDEGGEGGCLTGDHPREEWCMGLLGLLCHTPQSGWLRQQ